MAAKTTAERTRKNFILLRELVLFDCTVKLLGVPTDDESGMVGAFYTGSCPIGYHSSMCVIKKMFLVRSKLTSVNFAYWPVFTCVRLRDKNHA